MKAIKLASVFAVSAVAAAVSTATFAAEPVFSGEAGLVYNMTSGSEAWTSEGEVNIKIDTGVVYIDLDMEKNGITDSSDATNKYTDGGFDIDEAYVTQGAVQFGDFDGSLSDDAAYNAGVWAEGEYSDGSVTDLGVRYSVMPGLTVGLEMVEGKDGVGFAAAYSQDLGVATLGLSAGSYSSDSDTTESTNYSVGIKANAGMATVIASYTGGEVNKADLSTAVVGADAAITEAFSVSVQHSMDLEAEQDNTELTAYYTVGDVTYWASNQSGDKEYTGVGAYVGF